MATELTTSQKAFVEELQNLRRAGNRRAADHPFIHRMLDGSASPDQVQIQCLQFYFHTVAFVSGLSRLASRCNVPEIQREVAEGVYEEYTGKLTGTGPHLDLYLGYAQSWGWNQETLRSTVYMLPETMGLINWYMYAADHLPPLAGIAVFNVAAEGVNVSFPDLPGLSHQISEALTRHYGKTQEDVLFWDLHDHADQEHSTTGVEVLVRHTVNDEQRNQIRTAARMTSDAWYQFVGCPANWSLNDCFNGSSAEFY